MRTITLNNLTLRNFQGGNFVLDIPQGKDVSVCGENASGKTRLVSGWSWLLFSKDAMNRADFQIKNLDATGEPEHNLQHSVEIILDVDGEQITLMKTHSEVWQRKRGSSQATFTGHTNEFHINGIPTQKKLFDEKVAEIAGPEETFRLLTSPTVFPALPWQRQRSILLDIVGDLKDSDVIASDERLSKLPAILGKRTIDDMRKIIAVRRAEINKELPSITIRVDEVRRGMPDVSGLDRKQLEDEVSSLELVINKKKLKLQGIDSGGEIADLTKKLSGLNADLRKMEDAHRSGSLSTQNRLNQQISEVEAHANGQHRRMQAIYEDLKTKDRGIQTADSQLAELRKRWMAVDAEIFKDTTSDTCPTCNQALPSDRVQEARDKALGAFNISKAQRLGEIDSGGKDLKANRDRLAGEIEALKKEREVITTNLPETETKLKTLTEERDALKRSSEDFTGLPHWPELSEEIENTEILIKEEREGKAQDIEKVKVEISALQTEFFAAKAKVDMFTRRERGERRIEELKIEEKKLSAEFEKLEGELYLIEQFIKAKVAMLTDRINGKFEMVRFKLFDTLINGGIEDCCEITVNGVPFNGGLNSGARTQAGCDIIRTLQQHFGMKAPVFCDNRESVTDLPRLSCQMISLVVSPEDKVLRVEVA